MAMLLADVVGLVSGLRVNRTGGRDVAQNPRDGV
jgi:hypothetical protein